MPSFTPFSKVASLDPPDESLAGWRAVVQRMVDKPGAGIGGGDTEAIAAYLASRSADASGDGEGGGGHGKPEPITSIFGTFSPTWRGGNDNPQDPGFIPEVWVGVNGLWAEAEGISLRNDVI